MKKAAALVCFLCLVFTTAFAADDFLYYDSYAQLPQNLNFTNENGKAEMLCQEGYLSIKTNAYSYPQFWTPVFYTAKRKLVIELKSRFVFGGKSTIRLAVDGTRYTVAQLSGFYEWTLNQVVIDFDTHKAALYCDGVYVSTTDYSGVPVSAASRLQLNVGHELNVRESQYDYIAVYEKSDTMRLSLSGVKDAQTLVVKTANPVPKSLLVPGNFSVAGNQTVAVKADENLPKTYHVTLGAPLKKGDYVLTTENLADIFNHPPDTENIEFAVDHRDIDVIGISAAEYNGGARMTVTVRNYTESDTDCLLAVVFYRDGASGAEGAFSGYRFFTIPLAANSGAAAYTTEQFEVPENCTYECFIWNNAEDMRILYPY